MKQLNDFSEIYEKGSLKNILFGNGLSIDLSIKFAYNNLISQCNDLIASDIELFKTLKTSNFETCLTALQNSILSNKIYGIHDNHSLNYSRIDEVQ